MPTRRKQPDRAANLAQFDETTLDRLVGDALDRIETIRKDLATEGMVIPTESGGRPNPKMAILRDEREWVRKAWATKYQGATEKDSNYFARPPQA